MSPGADVPDRERREEGVAVAGADAGRAQSTWSSPQKSEVAWAQTRFCTPPPTASSRRGAAPASAQASKAWAVPQAIPSSTAR